MEAVPLEELGLTDGGREEGVEVGEEEFGVRWEGSEGVEEDFAVEREEEGEEG